MLAALLRASLTGAIGVVLVWLACRLLPNLRASTRAMLWWCVAAKFVIALVWVAPIRLPILPAMPFARPALAFMGARSDQPRIVLLDGNGMARTFKATMMAGQGNHPAIALPARQSITVGSPGLEASMARWFFQLRMRWFTNPVRAWIVSQISRWSGALLMVWVIGVLLAAGVGVRRWRRARFVVAQSTPASPDVIAMARGLAARLSLRSVPEVRMSNDVDTPLVVGLRAPVMLLPTLAFARLSERQQQMSICHELAHLKRHDLRLGCVPALSEALFFFHPLSSFAAREYSLSREAACDAAVLDALDAQPSEYGLMLLDLGVINLRTGFSAAAASSSSSTLKRRLLMLADQPESSNAPRASRRSMQSHLLAAVAIVVAVIAMLPVQLVARSASPSRVTQPAPRMLPASRLMQMPRVSNPGSDYILFHADGSARTGRMIAVVSGPGPGALSERRFVFLESKVPAQGPIASAIAHARQFTKPREGLLWFRRDDREYVVRDPAILRDVEGLWRPVFTAGAAPTRASDSTSPAVPREPTEAERAQALRDIDAKWRELEAAMAQLTAQRGAGTTAKDADARIAEPGKSLQALGREMEQALHPDEVRALTDRAIANGQAIKVR